MKNRIEHKADHFSAQQVVDKIQKGVINLSPLFQRKFIWNKNKQNKLIESILYGVPIPPIYVIDVGNNEKDILNVVDGKQRLQTIFNFLTNHFQYCDEEENSKQQKYFRDLTENEQDRVASYQVHFTILSKDNNIDTALDVFRRLNEKPASLNPIELINSLYYQYPVLQNIKEWIENNEKTVSIFRFTSKQKDRGELVDVLIKGLTASRKPSLSRVDSNAIREYLNETKENPDKEIAWFNSNIGATLGLLKEMFEDNVFKLSEKGRTNKVFATILLGALMNNKNRPIITQHMSEIKEQIISDITMNKNILRQISKNNIEDAKRTLEEIISSYDIRDKKRTFTEEERSVLYAQQKGLCALCGLPVCDKGHIDHKHPWAQGGPTTIDNGQLTHRCCNLSKGNSHE